MKKNYFSALSYSALAAFCLFSSVLSAQSFRYGVQVSGGISGAIEPVKQFPEFKNAISPLFSYGAAVTAEKTFQNPRFGILIEPGFTKKGYQGYIFGGFEKNKIDLYYLNAPLSLFYQPLKNDRLRIGLGGELGYLLADRLNGNEFIPLLNDFHEKFDLSGHVSVQTTLLSKIALGFKASRSFSPLASIQYSDDNGNNLGLFDWFNYNLNLYARYYIN